MRDLLRATFKSHDYDIGLIANKGGTIEEAIKRAYIQQDSLKKGEPVEPMPGEPPQHVEIHEKALAIGRQKLEQLAETAENMEDLSIVTEYLDALQEHTAGDTMQPAEFFAQNSGDEQTTPGPDGTTPQDMLPAGEIGAEGMPPEMQGMTPPMDQVATVSTMDPGEAIRKMMANGRPDMAQNPMQAGVGMPMQDNAISGNQRLQSEDAGGMLPPNM